MAEVTKTTPRHIGVQHLVLIALSAALRGTLGVLSATIVVLPGIPFIYLPMLIEPALGIWFGIWGAIGALLGTLMDVAFIGTPLFWFIPIGLVDAYLPVLAIIFWKYGKMDPAMRDVRSWVLGVVFYVIGLPTQSYLYNLSISPLGWYPLEYILGIEGLIVTMIPGVISFTPYFLVLFALSPFVMKTSFYVEGWY